VTVQPYRQKNYARTFRKSAILKDRSSEWMKMVPTVLRTVRVGIVYSNGFVPTGTTLILSEHLQNCRREQRHIF
jgi:hypothetical protein